MPNLPVPTWAQEVPGNFITSALWNANVYNGGTFLTNPPLFVGTQSAVQSVANGTWAALTLDTTQVDTYAGHSNVTNNSRYTAQVAGWYTVCGVSCWTTNSTGSRTARITVNGVIVIGAGTLLAAGTLNAAIATAPRSVFLNAGDYVEVQGGQNSGGALSTAVSTEAACALWVVWSHA